MNIKEKISKKFKDKCVTTDSLLSHYRTDLYPKNQILKLFYELPDIQPLAVVFPENDRDVLEVLKFAKANKVSVIPFGGGSGVIGGTEVIKKSIVVDMKRMRKILKLDKENHLVHVESGIIGQELEEYLNHKGFTMGHFPSSIYCSTVGGYVSTRSAGQYSSKYGKFEDIVYGIKVITPDRGELSITKDVESLSGTDFLNIFTGHEGTLGIITEVTLKIHKLPEHQRFFGVSFPDIQTGIDAMRTVMQANLKPSVFRLYDPFDSFVALSKKTDKQTKKFKFLEAIEDIFHGAFGKIQREALFQALAAPNILNFLVSSVFKRSLLIAGFEGRKKKVEKDFSRFIKIVKNKRGILLGEEVGLSWKKHRYSVSFKQPLIFYANGFVDTMEVATSWSNLMHLYSSVVSALKKKVFIMAHFSHAYPNGCSIYFTFAGAAKNKHQALKLYADVWQEGLEAVIQAGSAISHHHGVGILKQKFLSHDVIGGHRQFKLYKKVFDSENVMNPGKLWNFE